MKTTPEPLVFTLESHEKSGSHNRILGVIKLLMRKKRVYFSAGKGSSSGLSGYSSSLAKKRAERPCLAYKRNFFWQITSPKLPLRRRTYRGSTLYICNGLTL